MVTDIRWCLERAFIIECSECSNEHFVATEFLDEANDICVRLGWTADWNTEDVFCPSCSKAPAVASPVIDTNGGERGAEW